MGESFLSTIWYRVAELKPTLKPHIRVHRHRYRGEPWYVLHDVAAGRVHRFTPAAYFLIGQFDGTRTVDDIWQSMAAQFDEDAPSQDDVISLLGRLHKNDLIRYPGTPDVAELLERHNKQANQIWKQNLTNPVSIRIPLWDPNAFLTKTMPAMRWVTGWFGLLLWAGLVTWGLITAGLHWEMLTSNLTDRLLATQNLLITLITYPLLKAAHELMHGWLVKARGGDVHEMGIMFLVFFPVPYVDASASAAFRNKWHRIAVSAGGILVETAAAAIAVIIWVNAESGLVSALAFNVFTIGGLSTIIVNGNPLLKFDGYYMFTDLIEIPNLGPRANRYLGWLIQRRVFGAKSLKPDRATLGEKIWFVLYAPAAFIYRMIVMIGIALFVAGKFFFFGVLIALWSIWNAIFKPLFKHLRHVMTAPGLRKVRGRAQAISFGTIAVVVALALTVPLPLRTDAEGIVHLPDAAYIRAGAPGFVRDVMVAQGALVAPGAAVAALEDPTLDAQIDALRWRAEEHRRRLLATQATDRSQAAISTIALEEAEGAIARETGRQAELVLRARLAGAFEPALPWEGVEGRYLAQGDLVGWVLPAVAEIVRVAVPQEDAALVRDRLRGVEIKLAGRLEDPHTTQVARMVPAAQLRLPSRALTQASGGRMLTDPSDPEGQRALAPFFLVDLEVPASMADAPYGLRVLVRFDHGTEPAGAQIWRRVRQLFLAQFNA